MCVFMEYQPCGGKLYQIWIFSSQTQCMIMSFASGCYIKKSLSSSCMGGSWDVLLLIPQGCVFSELCVMQVLTEIILFHTQKLVWKCWQSSGCPRPRPGNEQGEQGGRTAGSVTGSTQRTSLRSLTKWQYLRYRGENVVVKLLISKIWEVWLGSC